MTKVLAVLATLVLALLGAQVARADADFTDPTGDANGAPDVTNVSVFNDSANRVIFFAKIAGGKAMEADGEVGFIVDSDKNRETGDGGWDYWAVVNGAKQWNLYRWDGAAWVESPSTTVKVFVFDDVLYFGVDRAELGNTASFDFFVDASKFAGDQVVATDAAPDGEAFWSYATVTKAYGLVASPIVAVTKGGARAGKPFVAGYLFGRTDSPEPTVGPKSTCAATARHEADRRPGRAGHRGRHVPRDRAEDRGGEDHGREAAEADADDDGRRQDGHEVVLDEDQEVSDAIVHRRRLPRSGEVRRRRTQENASVPAAHMNRLFLSTAAAIYAVVFVAFLLLEHAGLGIGHFYYLAIALVALALGPAWGAAAGGVATVLYTVGVLLNHALPSSEIFTISTPIRLVNYVAIGALLGWFAAHYRTANAELQVLAQRDLVTGCRTRAHSSSRSTGASRPASPSRCSSAISTTRPLDEDRDEALRRVSEVLSPQTRPGSRRRTRRRRRVRGADACATPSSTRRSWPCSSSGASARAARPSPSAGLRTRARARTR